MTTSDFSPLFRYGIGFDRVKRALDAATATGPAAHPSYDIIRQGEDDYRLVMVVSGCTHEDVEIEVKENVLKVSATPPSHAEDVTFVHRGIAADKFEHLFQLADHIEVESARVANGLLQIDLRRVVPETLKPRRIPVTADGHTNKGTIENRGTIEGVAVNEAKQEAA